MIPVFFLLYKTLVKLFIEMSLASAASRTTWSGRLFGVRSGPMLPEPYAVKEAAV